MKPKLFDGKEVARPFQYPEAIKLMEAIQHAYWLHSEVTFNSDVNEFQKLKPHHKSAVERCLLAISTVEVKVKDFWGQLGNHFPFAEWSNLGATHMESESRHFMAYSHLLERLNLEYKFQECLEVPAIRGRFTYLNKYLSLSPSNSNKRQYIIKLILFSVLIENVSLFGSFAPIMYFYRYEGIMQDIRNIVMWTSQEESLHFLTGATLVNILREEYPEYFDEELNEIIKKACIKSVKYEKDILDWIFEEGELEYMSKESVLNFMKDRVNNSMVDMGFEKVFQESLDLQETLFFEEEVFMPSLDDFFAVRPVDYTLNDISMSSEDLF